MRCKHCGMSEDEHHAFEPIIIPDGCVCDPMTWDSAIAIPAPCDSFDGGTSMYCKKCEHDEACHSRR